jgi:hypothetical protein
MTMGQLTRLTKFTLRRAAAAGVMLAAALFTTPAAATIADPAMFCDLQWAGRIERAFDRGLLMPISAYDDDPFVRDAGVECVPDQGFYRADDGTLYLWNSRVTVHNEDKIYRRDPVSGEFKPFAWNPWPTYTVANADGSFRFPEEPRFPLFVIERGPDGKPILRDGLQVWQPLDLHLGMTTVFEAASKVKDAADDWSGRLVDWGVDGVLDIETAGFVDLNAFYSPSTRALFFGVIPYRLAGTTQVKMFETATSWEMAAHEAGHAVLHGLKPNVDESDPGFNTWGESFADQMEMWTSLRDAGRVRALLAGPDLAQSNALSRMGEVYGALVGSRPATRDAVNDATVSTTEDEAHDRSEILTGALYRLFVSIYDEGRRRNAERAMEQAGAVMGIFLTHTTDYTPENRMTLEDIGKAYLKVDAEHFGGRYRDQLVAEFRRREIFNAGSLDAWLAHEAALPDLRLAYTHHPGAAENMVRKNLDRLGVGPDFGLIVQSVTRDTRFRQTIVRVQLTLDRDADAVPLANHGVLVFRHNGTLVDYHAPLTPDTTSQVQALMLLDRARQLGLHRHGAPLSIVKKADGQLGVEARVMRGDGPNARVDAFTLDAPHGERREVVSRTWGNARQAKELERAGIVLSPDQIGQ